MKVSMIVSGDLRFDGRVQREAKSLRDAGHDVRLHDQGVYSPSVKERGKWLVRSARIILKEKPDVVHCHDLDTLPVGLVVKKLTGARLVYDAHEFWYDLVRDRHAEVVSKFFASVEPLLAKHADAVIAANEGVARYLETLGLNPVVLPNYQYLVSEEWLPFYDHRPFTLLYVGTLQPGRFVARAARRIPRLKDIWMRVYGAKDGGACRTFSHPPEVVVVPHMVEHKWVLPLTVASHAVLAMYDPVRLQNRCGMPNKVYEAMSAGRPVLVSEGTAAGELVERLGVGLACDYDEEDFEKALAVLRDNESLRDAIGRRAHRLARERFNWQAVEPKLLGLYRSVA